MNKRLMIGLWIPASVFLTACDTKKEEPKVPEAAQAPAAVPAPPVTEDQPTPPAKVRVLTADERAEKLGFARHLPPDIESLITLPNPSGMEKAIKESDFFKLMDDEMGLGGLEDEELDETEPEMIFEAGEITLAFGKTTSQQTVNLLALNRARTRLLMKGIAKALPELTQSGNAEELMMGLSTGMDPQMLQELLADPETGVGLLEKLAMPPIYIASRLSKEDPEGDLQELAGTTEMLGMMEGMVEVTEVEKAGQPFTGYTVLGEKVATTMESIRPMMAQMMDTPTADRLFAAIAKKNLVVLTGRVGDYGLLFIGSSVDELVLASAPSESILAGDSLAFFDAYADKELAAVVYGGADLVQKIAGAAGGLGDIADGLREGFAEADGLGDARDIQALLRIVAEREKALLQLGSHAATGTVAFFDQGLKIETYGGSDSGAADWDAANQLGHLGASEDIVIFSNMTANAQYAAKMRSYFEVLIETGYAMSLKFGEVVDEGMLAEMKAMTQLFDGEFREHAVALWESFNGDFNAGLGAESAVIIDFGGSAPAIPGVSQAVLDEAKFPRFSMVAPVRDRAKLASAWESMNLSTNEIIGKVSKMNGMEMPEQKPMSSEKNGFTTWFLPLPFFNDGFLPSVTLNDQWFALSSSKHQVFELLAKAEKKEATTTGMHFMMNFEALRAYFKHSLELIEKHPDELPMEEEELETLRRLSSAIQGLEKLSVHYRRENGLLRGSVHFKTP